MHSSKQNLNLDSLHSPALATKRRQQVEEVEREDVKRTRKVDPDLGSLDEDAWPDQYPRNSEPEQAVGDGAPEDFGDLQYLELHRVHCNCNNHSTHSSVMYRDRPRLLKGDNKITSLHGKRRMEYNIFDEDFAVENPFISFVIVRDYSCSQYLDQKVDQHAFQTVDIPRKIAKTLANFKAHLTFLQEDGPEADHNVETIYVISQDLKDCMDYLEGPYSQYDPEEDDVRSLVAPYVSIYHRRHDLENDLLQPSNHIGTLQLPHASLLFEYIMSSHAENYEEADNLFRRGIVTKRHLTKLFAFEDVVVEMTDTGPVGYFIENILESTDRQIEVECWNWNFDGRFYKRETHIKVTWPSQKDQVAAGDLKIFPLRYWRAFDSAIEQRMADRGRQFWRCRKGCLVECDSLTMAFEFQTARNRYMIDINTHKQMHPEDIAEHEEGEIVSAETEDPPDDNFLLLLPTTIYGYGFHDKKWSRLSVEGLRDVTWNREVFRRRLVLDEEKKELVEALITMHNKPTEKPQKTDIVEGKGKGLIILLHGGPGTGKTLTAESIAEFAGCPLYRVTCGDIGTEPESVEKYLETVLYIGTLWRCVVLLDEADVFLEERTPTDLQRNALVSVFLRTLEYFEGVLVLTSNRVGTFDEAFKSRVQLAIHYPPLEIDGRFQIWSMFFQDMLEGDEKTNQKELKDKLDFLARQDMNGRQIRNVINTARQLARYLSQVLGYAHIARALKVAREFEKYVTATRGHTDEEFAKAERIR